jgi:hypothetical protein
MPPARLVRAFLALWWTTGLAVFYLSAVTVRMALHHGDHHVVLLASFEALAALLFLLPWTVRPGAAGLLLTFAIAMAVHGPRPELLVYATVVVFVAVHGAVRPRLRTGQVARSA